jgi:hypothetical protein
VVCGRAMMSVCGCGQLKCSAARAQAEEFAASTTQCKATLSQLLADAELASHECKARVGEADTSRDAGVPLPPECPVPAWGVQTSTPRQ